jgi:GT2 family glycosyltransferase
VVLVDNASDDDVVERVRRELPVVRVVVNERNLGFAGGCNVALRDLRSVDCVALLNNDAVVEPGWLAPLMEALGSDETLGAVCPKICFATPFHEVALRISPTERRAGDRRELGVRVSGARAGDCDIWRRLQFVDGFWGPEFGTGAEADYQWSAGSALLRLPASGATSTLRLAADTPTRVTLSSGTRTISHAVGAEPSWYEIPIDGPPVDVIDNVGNVLTADGHGADRGYLEVDRGQFDHAEDVFAWCGAAVLLSTDYLRDVGLFDERLFLYYEDVELSWRGRTRGWRYRYVPTPPVRHVHAAATVEHSDASMYFNERNRLLVLTRHAPADQVARALVRYVLVTASYALRDVFGPWRRREAANPVLVRRRLRALRDFAAFAPRMLIARRQDRARPRTV